MPTIVRKERPEPAERPPKWDGPLIAWGRGPFDPRPDDDADGATVGGIRFVRAPDGTLVATLRPHEETPQ